MADAKQDMLPDSTQGETPDQKKGTKRKESKDGKKKKKGAKKKSKVAGKSKTKTGQGSEHDSDLDLSKEIQPLGFYLQDREELINEAFKAVKGLQLSNMVPDILKYVPLDELKRLCLNQLEGMSRKRIKHIIQGTEMVSSSDSDESAPEDDVGAVTMTTASVEADPAIKTEEEKKDTVEMERCVDSTVKPVTQPHIDSQRVGEGSKEDIDGVPVEIDVNIEELAFGKPATQPGSTAVKNKAGDGASKTAGKPSKETSRTKGKGSTEKHSDHVSSSHHRSRSRSPRRRRSWSSRSRSRDRHSRSQSRSRRRSWSRSRSRSWSRSWSRSSRSRSRTRSPERKKPPAKDPPSPSPPPSPPHVDAIQMRYPTPPTPSGSLSSGEIREILELESEEEEEEEEDKEYMIQKEEQIRRKLEGLVGDREGLERKVSGKMTCVSVTSKLKDAASGVDGSIVVQPPQAGDVGGIRSVSHSFEDVTVGNAEAVSMETSKKAGSRPDKTSCEEDEDDDDEEDDDSDDDDDDDDEDDDSGDSDDDSEDDEEDDDINLDLLDLGVDMSKAAGQPSQLALARASMKPPSSSNAPEEKKDSGSGEAELEVLELELRARAIRSLMHKCLKEDEKT